MQPVVVSEFQPTCTKVFLNPFPRSFLTDRNSLPLEFQFLGKQALTIAAGKEDIKYVSAIEKLIGKAIPI